MKDKPETLVLLSPAFPGDESQTHWVPTQQVFVNTLRQQYPGLHIIVLAFFYPYEARTYTWHGVEVIGLNGSGRGGPGRHGSGRRGFGWRGLARPRFWYEVWRVLNTIRRENRIIGLFSFWCGECALIGHWFGRRYGIRHLCWICGQDARKTNPFVRFIRPASSELIAMSDFLADEFHRNHHILPGHRIYNGIDPDLFPSFPTGQRSIDLLGAGSLSRLKQYDILVLIAGSLRPEYPDIRAVICGEGEDRQELEQLIRVQRLQRHVTLAGERPHREVLGLMQQSKILLHPSSYEGFGVVCLEALYAGARVVSFIKPLDREVPNWYIVKTVEEMASKVRDLLQEPEPVYRPEPEHTMQDSVHAVMRLFGREVVSPSGR
jgi:glycosyltransferase involved in cell wall biosynthesis